MSEVRFERKIETPPALAFQALGEILRDIAEREPAWQGFAFHADLGDAGLPDVGYIAIPIVLALTPPTPGADQYEIVVTAARHAESFPALKGVLGVTALGTSSSAVWLTGTYNVPLKSLGALLNATIVRGVAKRTIENFLDDLALACRARIEKRESEFMRYALFQHGAR